MTWRVHCRLRRPRKAGVHRREQKGQGHQGFPAPLDSPTFPLDATPFGRASKMRGAHRGVWCSKGTPLMEAEFFAAERCRPVPSGRALSCAANHARKIQGLTASQNLPDARNRAPAPPFRRATAGSRGAKEGLGESRGGKGTIWCPCPLLSPPPDGGIPAGEHRHSRPPQAAILRALRQGVFRLQRRTAVSAEPLALC